MSLFVKTVWLCFGADTLYLFVVGRRLRLAVVGVSFCAALPLAPSPVVPFSSPSDVSSCVAGSDPPPDVPSSCVPSCVVESDVLSCTLPDVLSCAPFSLPPGGSAGGSAFPSSVVLVGPPPDVLSVSPPGAGDGVGDGVGAGE